MVLLSCCACWVPVELVHDVGVPLAGCQALAQTLPVMPYLTQLCLSQTQLTDTNLQILLHVLKVRCCPAAACLLSFLNLSTAVMSCCALPASALVHTYVLTPLE